MSTILVDFVKASNGSTDFVFGPEVTIWYMAVIAVMTL